MKINKVSIIGNGFVGNAIYQNIKDSFPTFVYDKLANRSLNSLNECLSCDLIFVCLPTPMKTSNGDECNLSFINNFFESVPLNTKGIFAIKSTVPIGTTKILQNLRKDLKIIHNPEFLTVANSVNDFKNSERNVLGGNLEDIKIVESFYKIFLPNCKNILVDSSESEAIKYFSNSYLATKVAYFNLVFDLCNKFNLNFENVRDGIIADSRIGKHHTKVPGPDGDRGFGGTCFPKDINALINTFEQNDLNCDILKEIWKYNKNIRKNWDWAESKSAVYNGE